MTDATPTESATESSTEELLTAPAPWQDHPDIVAEVAALSRGAL